MSTHIIINNREINSPVAKGLIIVGAISSASIVTTLVVFVLLPFVGIVVTFSIGLLLALAAATILGLGVATLGTLLFGWLFGPTEFSIRRQRK